MIRSTCLLSTFPSHAGRVGLYAAARGTVFVWRISVAEVITLASGCKPGADFCSRLFWVKKVAVAGFFVLGITFPGFSPKCFDSRVVPAAFLIVINALAWNALLVEILRRSYLLLAVVKVTVLLAINTSEMVHR